MNPYVELSTQELHIILDSLNRTISHFQNKADGNGSDQRLQEIISNNETLATKIYDEIRSRV